MRWFFFAIALGFMSLSIGWYCHLIRRKGVYPAPSTWVMFAIAIVLSFTTYWFSAQHSMVSNVANTFDLVVIVVVLVSLWLWARPEWHLTPMDVLCYTLTLITAIFWLTARQANAVWANLFLQGIMTLAYLPTFNKLWNAKDETTEAPEVWLGVCCASIFALQVAIIDHDFLAKVYAGRSMVMSFVTMVLVLRIRDGQQVIE